MHWVLCNVTDCHHKRNRHWRDSSCACTKTDAECSHNGWEGVVSKYLTTPRSSALSAHGWEMTDRYSWAMWECWSPAKIWIHWSDKIPWKMISHLWRLFNKILTCLDWTCPHLQMILLKWNHWNWKLKINADEKEVIPSPPLKLKLPQSKKRDNDQRDKQPGRAPKGKPARSRQ